MINEDSQSFRIGIKTKIIETDDLTLTSVKDFMT